MTSETPPAYTQPQRPSTTLDTRLFCPNLTARKYTIVRDMDPELWDAEFTTGDPEEADELLEMAHARRPWAHVPVW